MSNAKTMSDFEPIKVHKNTKKLVREIAEDEGRTMAKQIEYWAKRHPRSANDWTQAITKNEVSNGNRT